MRGPAEAEGPPEDWRPRWARGVAALIGAIDRAFDRVYSSAYNPLHRTGTLAALCLLITLVTGVYLLFVYEIGRPWESMRRIQNDVLLGRPIRALHRYASDVAVVAVILHVARLVAQGKTWGPRILAWITGVLLTGTMLLSAMTGFVLVWDQLGQKLAVAGARILRLLPLFPEPPDRAFNGERPVASAFLFMNLFLHVAVPLGMIGLLWLHTSRLARAAWFPERRVALGALAGLIVLAVAWPAPLPPAADLLAIPGRVATDWFYAFWLPLAERSPLAGLLASAALTALLLVVPWLLRPRAGGRPEPARVDPERCEGCQQCFRDCPFDAIRMVAGAHPEVHPLRADVQASLCVGCGLCAGSCSSLAIGPPARTGRDQLVAARQVLAGMGETTGRALVVACRNDGAVAGALARHLGDDPTVARFEVDCAGTLHPSTVAYLASRFASTLILTCPAQNCLHREGATLADARILRGQRPAVPDRIDQRAVRVLHGSMGEWPRIVEAIAAARGRGTASRPAPAARGARAALAAVATAVLLAMVALGSGWPQGRPADHALLRLGWRLAGQIKERCRDLTPEELARRPVHMRAPRECASEVLAYDLTAAVDGQVVTRKRVRSPGLRADRPLSVEEEIEVPPGEHDVTVTFTPAGGEEAGRVLSFEGTIRFERGRVALITYENERMVVR